MLSLLNQQSHTTHTHLIFKKKKSTQPKIGQNFINVNKNPSIYIILNSQNLLERLAMHAFLKKYIQKLKKNSLNFQITMQNLKINKNTNNSFTLKINIVLNVQNIKEIKGFEDFP